MSSMHTTTAAGVAQTAEARRLLVEGRAVLLGQHTVRFFPSYWEIARDLRCHRSTVARWVQRDHLLEARHQVLAADRRASALGAPATTEALVVQTLVLVNARWAMSPRPPSARAVATLLRLIACVLGATEGRPRLLRELERLRAQLLFGRPR